MGITVSHTAFPPIALISTLVGFVSFAITLGTFLIVFWSTLKTFAAAPEEISDYLSSLKQGLLEERRHLRRSRRRLKNLKRDQSHGPRESDDDFARGYSSVGEKKKKKIRARKRTMQFDRDSSEEEVLRVTRITVKNLIKSFRELEQPFLKPEYQQHDSSHWSTALLPASTSPYYSEKYTQYPLSDDDSPNASHMFATHRHGHEYRHCGFKERWIWVHKKAAVLNLSSVLSKVEVRRTAHEVGEVLSIMSNIGRDLEDMKMGMHALEGRLSRVVGVRRVE